jgi:hypothetical protein
MKTGVHAITVADTGQGRDCCGGFDNAALDELLEYLGEIRPLRSWAAEWGLPPDVLVARVAMGLPKTVWATPHVEADWPDWWSPFVNPHWPDEPPAEPCACRRCLCHRPLNPRSLTAPTLPKPLAAA